MDEESKTSEQNSLRKIVNSSGFPLQIAIENEVRNISSWKVVSSEHPWRSRDSSNSGFIDLVIERKEKRQYPNELICGHKARKLIIECKRVRTTESKNAERPAWVFLCHEPSKLERHHVRAWLTQGKKDTLRTFEWKDVSIGPPSPESAFCAILGQDNKRPLLERLAGELIEATESLAIEEYPLKCQLTEGIKERPNFEEYFLYYFPVIVTTANLYICKFDAGDISLTNGEVADCNFEPVPMVRFRKSLATRDISESEDSLRDISEIARAKERTVLIINAQKLNETLLQMEFDDD